MNQVKNTENVLKNRLKWPCLGGLFGGERSEAKVGERSEAWQNGGKWEEKGEKKGKSLF